MNQEKIGKFILKLRKEKNMTQSELASRINVTDRAVSKWENGRGMPELSLMKPLCNELGITINELLNGDRITDETYQEKLEENMISTIDYKDKNAQLNYRKSTIFLTLLIILAIVTTSMFLIDIRRMINHENVLFSTWGLHYIPPIDLQSVEIEIEAARYLVAIGDSEYKKEKNLKTFASLEIFQIQEDISHSIFTVYAWVLIENLYLENDLIMQDSGASLPFKFIIRYTNNKYEVIESIVPRDGSYYLSDIKEIFPKIVRNSMNSVYKDGTYERLRLDIQQQAKLFFHK